jgi:hypothetical protein
LSHAKRRQQCLEFEESRIFVVGQDIGQNFAGVMVNCMPEPTLVPFRLDETPHLVGFRLKVLPLAQLNRRLAHIQLGQPSFIHGFELGTFFERFDHGGWTNFQYSFHMFSTSPPIGCIWRAVFQHSIGKPLRISL